MPLQFQATSPLIPLIDSQRRYWQRHSSSSPRMCATAECISGLLNIKLLQNSIQELIRRHEALRTRIVLLDGLPFQYIEPAGEYRLKVVDLSERLGGDLGNHLDAVIQKFLDQMIDLTKDPLFEARLWRLSDRKHVLVVLIDHVVSDGVSNGIIAREIWSLYDRAVQGQPFSLPPLNYQFSDYANWLRQTHDAWMMEHGAYWMDDLKGVCPLEIPCDDEIEESSAPAGAAVHAPFGEDLSAGLRRVAQRERTPLSLVVLTAYVVVISRWCQRKDVLIPVGSNGRYRRPGLQNVVGCMVSTVHLRVALVEDDTFRGLLARIRSKLCLAFQHQDFDRVQNFIPECASDAAFNWQPTNWIGGRLDHHVTLECSKDLDRHEARCVGNSVPNQKGDHSLKIEPWQGRSPGLLKFSPVFFDTGSGIHMVVTYRRDRLHRRTIDRFCKSFLSVMEQMATDASTCIASVDDRISWR